MLNVTKPLAIDRNGAPIQNGSPDGVALVARYSDNGAVSSVITMNDNTTLLEVSATGTPAIVRWVPSTDTAASVISTNYDVIVPPNTLRKLPVPHETTGTSSIVGLGVQAGLYRRYAWKNIGAGSVMSNEY